MREEEEAYKAQSKSTEKSNLRTQQRALGARLKLSMLKPSFVVHVTRCRIAQSASVLVSTKDTFRQYSRHSFQSQAVGMGPGCSLHTGPLRYDENKMNHELQKRDMRTSASKKKRCYYEVLGILCLNLSACCRKY